MIGLLDSITEGVNWNWRKRCFETFWQWTFQISGEKIGFIFQSFFLLPGLTAQENVAEGLLYQGISRTERLKKATEVLDQVGLGDRLTHLPKELSGGSSKELQ